MSSATLAVVGRLLAKHGGGFRNGLNGSNGSPTELVSS
jgi:hypothetical protein